jgi:hypothetical protein
VLYADWEFDGESHRERFGALFGDDMPPELRYARCDRPMVQEADRLRRLVQQYQIDYLVCDSIVFACGAGVPAESAEAAATYFAALRQIGVGSLNLAHTTKQGSESDEKRQQSKPFGSVFWANGARATWFLKGEPDPGRLSVSLYPRKANTGPLGPPVGWSLAFEGGRIAVGGLDVASHPLLGRGLPTWQRVKEELRGGARTYAVLAEALGVPVNTITQEIGRKPRLFTKVLGMDGVTRIGLLQDGS